MTVSTRSAFVRTRVHQGRRQQETETQNRRRSENQPSLVVAQCSSPPRGERTTTAEGNLEYFPPPAQRNGATPERNTTRHDTLRVGLPEEAGTVAHRSQSSNLCLSNGTDPVPCTANCTVWRSSRPLITPQTRRPLPQPHTCPLCPTTAACTARSVSQFLAHLRNRHSITSRRGAPRRTELDRLNQTLAMMGMWYCFPHRRYLGTTVGPPHCEGLFTFSYIRRPQCAVDTSPPRYVPVSPCQLAADTDAAPNTTCASIVADTPPPTMAINLELAPSADQPLPALQEIFTTHVPIISHIPTKFRPALADVLSDACNAAALATEENTEDRLTAFTKLFLFAPVLLANPSHSASPERYHAQQPTNAEIYRTRIELWRKGHFQTLWEATKRLVAPVQHET